MLTVRLPDDLVKQIDEARGDVPRERWVRRVLTYALSRDPMPAFAARASEETPHAMTAEQHRVMREAAERQRQELERVQRKPAVPAETPLPKIAPRRWAK